MTRDQIVDTMVSGAETYFTEGLGDEHDLTALMKIVLSYLEGENLIEIKD